MTKENARDAWDIGDIGDPIADRDRRRREERHALRHAVASLLQVALTAASAAANRGEPLPDVMTAYLRRAAS